MLDSLVRVSRRGDEARHLATTPFECEANRVDIFIDFSV
jgi:hypothetical protein